MSNVWVLGAGFSQPLRRAGNRESLLAEDGEPHADGIEGAPGYTDIADVAVLRAAGCRRYSHAFAGLTVV
ncbi:MAG: hypothetical protein IPK60_00005 [Sandaracinaceae bacterium]|nr:hypothetical protein [Sandaracinaceae bacterium]